MLDLLIYMLDFIVTVRDPSSSSVSIGKSIEYMKSAVYEVLPPHEYSWEFPNWDSSKYILILLCIVYIFS
jgi:hypothetical protein